MRLFYWSNVRSKGRYDLHYTINGWEIARRFKSLIDAQVKARELILHNNASNVHIYNILTGKEII